MSKLEEKKHKCKTESGEDVHFESLFGWYLAIGDEYKIWVAYCPYCGEELE